MTYKFLFVDREVIDQETSVGYRYLLNHKSEAVEGYDIGDFGGFNKGILQVVKDNKSYDTYRAYIEYDEQCMYLLLKQSVKGIDQL